MADVTRTTTKAKPASSKATTRTKRPGAKATTSKARAGATATTQRPAARRGTNGHGVDVPVPVFTPHMKTLHVPTPGMTYVEDVGRVVAGYLPPPERLAFYGGLGVAAVIGVLDWPVAAAIGVGTVIARRAGGMGARRPKVSTKR